MDSGAKRSSPPGAMQGMVAGSRSLDEPELDSALQLLVERALYITGATGAALALPQDKEMVCRASAGASAPAVGARLQVLSGLTGESIARRQLLRCDNAETDPRVNLEACRALGIASIVVLPLFRHGGEVRGLIELFSDHPYAFEERDLVALERMADLTSMALNLAEQNLSSPPARPAHGADPGNPVPPSSAAAGVAPRLGRSQPVVEASTPANSAPALQQNLSGAPAIQEAAQDLSTPAEIGESAADTAPAPPMAVPESLHRMQKCSACGFPISEGRTVCVDCERKAQHEARQNSAAQISITREEPAAPEPTSESSIADPARDEFIPAFLANAVPVKESWFSNHVNLLAIIVLILGILVAVVVFR